MSDPFDGEEFFAIDEEAIDAYRPMDTFTSHALRNNEFYLENEQDGATATWAAGGTGNRFMERAFTDSAFSSIYRVPVKLEPEMTTLRADIQCTVYEVDNNNSGPIDVRLRLLGTTHQNIEQFDDTSGSYESDSISLDISEETQATQGILSLDVKSVAGEEIANPWGSNDFTIWRSTQSPHYLRSDDDPEDYPWAEDGLGQLDEEDIHMIGTANKGSFGDNTFIHESHLKVSGPALTGVDARMNVTRNRTAIPRDDVNDARLISVKTLHIRSISVVALYT